MRSAILFLTWAATSWSATHAKSVPDLDMAAMQKLLMDHDKVVLMLYANSCTRAREFLPTLEAIANQVRSLTFGSVDVKADQRMVGKGFAAGIELGTPALKAFFRNAPPGKRVLEYRGPPTLELSLIHI